MAPDVTWPKASEGGKITGKEEIRAYWTRQWSEFDPTVHPLALTAEEGGKTSVTVHQLVKSLQGELLSDSHVVHLFTIRSGLIASIELSDASNASAAFAHRS